MPENLDDRKLMVVTFQIMGQLHDVINLFYNNVIIEVYDNPLEIIDETMKHVLKEIRL